MLLATTQRQKVVQQVQKRRETGQKREKSEKMMEIW
jgi:hypothetical protein